MADYVSIWSRPWLSSRLSTTRDSVVLLSRRASRTADLRKGGVIVTRPKNRLQPDTYVNFATREQRSAG
jgi:hypothetical protein